MARSGYSENYDISSNNQPSEKDFRRGIPMTVVSDNGPQFVSEEFEAFLRDYGITHRKVTPSGHRPTHKLNDLTELMRKPFVVPMSRGRTGAKNCAFSS